MECFHKSYAKLYKANNPGSNSQLENFLNDVPLPKLSVNHSAQLENPVYDFEVLDFINTLSWARPLAQMAS